MLLTKNAAHSRYMLSVDLQIKTTAVILVVFND